MFNFFTAREIVNNAKFWRDFLKASEINYVSFIHFILPLTRNTTTVYRNTLKIIYSEIDRYIDR